MKKRVLVIILLIIGITLIGCQTILGQADDVEEKVLIANMDTTPNISQYFPFLENTVLEYDGVGNEYAEQSRYFEFVDENRAQLKIMNPGTNIIKVLENKDGVLSEIYLEGEFYHIENMINTKPQKQEIILKEPLEVGNSWFTTEGNERKITAIDSKIELPYKTVDALEVTTVYEEDRYQKEYFAKGIGLVAILYVDGEFETKTLLRNIKNQPLILDTIVFYPLLEGSKIVYIQDKINFYTNQSLEKLIEDKLKNPPSDKLVAPLPSGAVINSIYLDRNSWVVNVDFSEELLSGMNYGSSFEYEILRSVINTLGKFYDTENVYISVDGKPYETGHFAIREGEEFKVDIEGIEDFNK